MKGEGDSRPTDLAAEIEAFAASTEPLSLHLLPPVEVRPSGVLLGKDTERELASVEGGGALECGGTPEGGAADGGRAPVPLEVHPPTPGEPHYTRENTVSPPCRGDPTNSTTTVREDTTTSCIPLEPHDDAPSLSLDVDIPVSSFERTCHSEGHSSVGSSPPTAGEAGSTVGVVKQGESPVSHFEPMDTVNISGEGVVSGEGTSCTPPTPRSCEQPVSPVVCRPRHPLCDSPTAQHTHRTPSLDRDSAKEKFVQSDMVDISDSSDRGSDSDSTESVGDNGSDNDDIDANYASYVNLFGGVEEVGGLLQCPQMEKLVTPLRGKAALFHSGQITHVAMTTISPTH